MGLVDLEAFPHLNDHIFEPFSLGGWLQRLLRIHVGAPYDAGAGEDREFVGHGAAIGHLSSLAQLLGHRFKAF